ncbi:MAG: adenylate/guanylate cyclase domain-containing protein [Sneathiella sp.]|nr:adenylate/guanylate cyclase domain-containing protein [Sneathiella sp.]
MSAKTQRRLAAILSVDVVAYSRLMGADEAGTLAAMQAHRRELWDPIIAEHGGRLVGTAGDSLLIEYASAVAAVETALVIQKEMIARNAEVPEEKRMRLRMGVNIGEVIVEKDDIFGDGVNIAARLQALADVGGIAISGNVHEQVRGKLDISFRDDGMHEVKNIEHPVHVWRWSEGPVTAAPAGVALKLPDKPSIAVLPFDNMSGDKEQEYFADGMTEDIITDLSKASGLFVIARNSSFSYKGRNPDIRDVCKELGVRYVLEGSVRRAGNRMRINAQLIDGRHGGHVWAERFDRNLEDIFAVQDEVTREIVAALKVELTPKEKDQRGNVGKVNPEAYDYFYRGRTCMFNFNAESSIEARRMFAKAIAIDPGMVAAYAMTAISLSTDYLNNWNGATLETIGEALAIAEKARDIDGNAPIAHIAASICLTWLKRPLEAEAAARKAIDLDPNLAQGYSALGQTLDFAGRHAEAVDAFQRALRLDPQFDIVLNLLGRAQVSLGHYDEAEANFRRRLIRSPRTDTTRAYLAALLGETGRTGEARELWKELMEINPDFDPEWLRTALPFTTSTWFDRFYGGLEKSGLLEK